MTDEPLADQIADHLDAEERTHDPRLDRLAQGTLGAAEWAELEREAQDDPALAEAIQIFTPASSAELDHLVDVARDAAGVDRVRPLRLLRVALPIAAIAAAAALFFSVSSTAPLPRMEMTVTAGDYRVRGPAGERRGPRVVAPDSELTLSLRPEVAVKGELAAELFAIIEGRARPIEIEVRMSEDGATRVRGTARRLTGIEAGAATVALVVGRPGRGPSPEALSARAGSTDAYSGPGWHVAQVQVVLRPVRAPPPPQ